MDADQDMNWKIEWDNGLNVDQQDTGLDTDFGIGLGVGQNTTVDWDFCLSWSTDSELHKPLVEQGYSYHHACIAIGSLMSIFLIGVYYQRKL